MILVGTSGSGLRTPALRLSFGMGGFGGGWLADAFFTMCPQRAARSKRKAGRDAWCHAKSWAGAKTGPSVVSRKVPPSRPWLCPGAATPRHPTTPPPLIPHLKIVHIALNMYLCKMHVQGKTLQFDCYCALSCILLCRSHATLLVGDAWGRVFIWTSDWQVEVVRDATLGFFFF